MTGNPDASSVSQDPADQPLVFDGLASVVRGLDETAKPTLQTSPWLGTGLRCKAFVARQVFSVLNRLWFHRPANAKPARVVVYTVGTLGDNVVMAPALAAIRAAYPTATITHVNNVQVWSRCLTEDFLRRLPYHDRLLCLSRLDCPVQRQGMRFRMAAAELADLRTDLFVNLSPFGNRGWSGAVFREMLWARRMGARWAVGFSVTPSVARGPAMAILHRFVANEPTRHRTVLSQLGLKPPSDWCLPRDVSSVASVTAALASFALAPDSFGLIHPGAKFSSKRWPPEHFAAVAADIHCADGLRSVITGTAEETALCEAVANASMGSAVNWAGRTTAWELVELTRLARFCLTNDTGTMHVAAAVGTPVVALFSAYQNPYRWFPDTSLVRAFWTPTECAGCGAETCAHLRCLNAIPPSSVAAGCRAVMAAAGRRRLTSLGNPTT